MMNILQIGFAFLLVFAVFCFITLYTLMQGLRLIVQAKNNLEPQIKIAPLNKLEKWKREQEQKRVSANILSNG